MKTTDEGCRRRHETSGGFHGSVRAMQLIAEFGEGSYLPHYMMGAALLEGG